MNLLRRICRALGFFPCPLCGKGEGGGDNELCPACRKSLPLIPAGTLCPGCGAPLDGALELCSQCLEMPRRHWKGAVSVMFYRDAGREMMHRFKFQKHPELALPFGRLAAEALRRAAFPVELVVPIPLHWTRLFSRPYNQAELVARVLCGEMALPMVRALRRSRKGKHQAELSRSKRMQNPRGLFRVSRPDAIRGKRILLLDDVMTTGATLQAAALALKRAGAGEIYVLTCCRTPQFLR